MKQGLLNDILFKIVFGGPQSEPLLAILLNALLELRGDQRIIELSILNPNIHKAFETDKGIVLDVRARDATGRQYNIEVQLRDQASYIQRSLYYVSRLYTEQLVKGSHYSKLAKTIGISIVDFIAFPDNKPFHSRFRFHDAAQNLQLTDWIEMHYPR